MKGGTQWRMAMAFPWVRLERPLCLCSAWARRVRFPGVGALGGSSARRLGGLTGRQLTGPVAEAPEVMHGSELSPKREIGPRNRTSGAIPRRGRCEFPLFCKTKFPQKSYYEKAVPCPGVWYYAK